MMSLVRIFLQVFSRPWVVATAVVTALGVFALSLWLRNLWLIVAVAQSPRTEVGDVVRLLGALLGGIVTDTTALGAVLIIMTALLFGVNAGLVIFYIKGARALPHTRESTAAVGGLVAAVLGAGCASCGTFLLGALLSSLGAAGALALLPLGGQELLIVSVGLLLVSISALTRSIAASKVCAIT